MRDLDVGDVLAPPQRLEQRVAEAQREQVLHRRLAQVVVDAEDLLLGEDAAHARLIARLRGQVVAQRLFQHDARVRRRSARRRASCSQTTVNSAGAVARYITTVSASRSSQPARAGRCVVARLRQVHAQVVQQRGEARELLGARAAWRVVDLVEARADQLAVLRRRCRSSRATPMMRPPSGSVPWRKAWNSAGISLRQARSPVPPNRTRSKLMA